MPRSTKCQSHGDTTGMVNGTPRSLDFILRRTCLHETLWHSIQLLIFQSVPKWSQTDRYCHFCKKMQLNQQSALPFTLDALICIIYVALPLELIVTKKTICWVYYDESQGLLVNSLMAVFQYKSLHKKQSWVLLEVHFEIRHNQFFKCINRIPQSHKCAAID